MITKQAEKQRDRIFVALRQIRDEIDMIRETVTEETYSEEDLRKAADDLEEAHEIMDNINL